MTGLGRNHGQLVHFNERELVELTLAIIAINGWNRLAIALRTEVGRYQAKPVA